MIKGEFNGYGTGHCVAMLEGCDDVKLQFLEANSNITQTHVNIFVLLLRRKAYDKEQRFKLCKRLFILSVAT
jgi:hypothetical protein